MGWLMGIEPTNAGITIRCVNHFATATIQADEYIRIYPAYQQQYLTNIFHLFKLCAVLEGDQIKKESLCD